MQDNTLNSVQVLKVALFPSEAATYIVLPSSWQKPVHPHIVVAISKDIWGHFVQNLSVGRLRPSLVHEDDAPSFEGPLAGFSKPSLSCPEKNFHPSHLQGYSGELALKLKALARSSQAAGMVKVMPSGTCESRR